MHAPLRQPHALQPLAAAVLATLCGAALAQGTPLANAPKTLGEVTVQSSSGDDGARHAGLDAWPPDARAGRPLPRPGEESADRRQLARRRRVGEAVTASIGEKSAEIGGGRVAEPRASRPLAPVAGEEREQAFGGGLVGADGVDRPPPVAEQVGGEVGGEVGHD